MGSSIRGKAIWSRGSSSMTPGDVRGLIKAGSGRGRGKRTSLPARSALAPFSPPYPLSRLRGEGMRLRATGSRIPERPRALARAGVRSRVGVRACFLLQRAKAALIRPPGTFSREAGEGKNEEGRPKRAAFLAILGRGDRI